jgi:hypothetical protein
MDKVPGEIAGSARPTKPLLGLAAVETGLNLLSFMQRGVGYDAARRKN